MNIKKKSLVFLLIGAFAVGCLFTGGITSFFSHGGTGLSGDEYDRMVMMEEKYSDIEEVWTYVRENYYFGITDEEIEDAVCRAIVTATGDQYSTYMDPEQYMAFLHENAGEVTGIGVSFSLKDGKYFVNSVVTDGPADKAGIKPGDYLLTVDGETYETLDEMGSHIRGEEGSEVTVEYERDGVVMSATMTRETVVFDSVTWEMMDDGIAHVTIREFNTNTYEEFLNAIDFMEENNARAFVLDLRNNGGGTVNTSVQIADELLDEGVIYSIEDVKGNESVYSAKDGKFELPFVILVNDCSASATEILTAALQDHDRAPVVGILTFGKGIIQQTVPMSNGSAVKVTIMQYFSPDGNAIHGVGITPDYIVEDPDAQMEKAIELLK